jgi:hypothetical protein
MYALLQKLPLEAWDAGDHYGVVDVLAVGSIEQVEVFLEAYRQRHVAACAEWDAWDSRDAEWDDTFDRKHEELCAKHHVTCLMKNVEFDIVPVGCDWETPREARAKAA